MDAEDYRVVAGVALLAAGVVTILGFVAAASQYPGYSATTQTISALGADAAPGAAALVFNGVMVLAGALLVVAAFGLSRAGVQRLVPPVVGLTGTVGLMGVGLFPMETGLPHSLAAVTSFAGVGVTALLVARSTAGPFASVSAVLGVLELLALVAFAALQGATPLDVGGLERVVAYLGLVWMVAYAGVLVSQGSTRKTGT